MIILFVLAVLRNVIERLIKRIGKFIHVRLERALTAVPLFRSLALKKYRKALEQDNEEVTLPFTSGKKLKVEQIFVPLSLLDEALTVPMDRILALQSKSQAIVLGDPGAGKTLLLKRFALGYAQNSIQMPRGATPVLLELSRLNSSKRPILQEIVDCFSESLFDNAESFVLSQLKRGKIFLLLDALDEIREDEREKRVDELKRFLRRYRKCPFIVTCRKAVYSGELDELAGETYEIVEFNDYQIRRFLRSWGNRFPKGKSVDQLMTTLRDRPKILSIARNPLLLTMIATLYEQPQFILPRSRAQFYDEALRFLLDWKSEARNYSSPQKRAVLKSLALAKQVKSHGGRDDRKTIPLVDAIEVLNETLPKLNLRTEDSTQILDEITKRSGLLISLDDGDKYQFAHQSLQEYLVASWFRDQPEEMLRHYRRNQTDWREVVRLWCGQDVDATSVIEQVFVIDPILGFECLADSQEIADDVARELIRNLSKLISAAEDEKTVAQSIGRIVGSGTARSENVLELLIEKASGSGGEKERRVAAWALARSNLPRAAVFLCEQYEKSEWYREPLISMGDVAVDALCAAIGRPSIDAIGDLGSIHTPSSISCVAGCLWNEDGAVRVRAATELGGILRAPDGEALLGEVVLPGNIPDDSWEQWVWSPFEEGEGTVLSVIAGRMVRVLAECQERVEGECELDYRVLIPTLLVLDNGSFREVATGLLRGLGVSSLSDAPNGLLNVVREKIGTVDRMGPIVGAVSRLTRIQFFEVVRRFTSEKAPTIDHWRSLSRRVEGEYDFRRSVHYVSTMLLMLVLSIVVLVSLMMIMGSAVGGWNSSGELASAAVMLLIGWTISWAVFGKDGSPGLRSVGSDPVSRVLMGVLYPMFSVTVYEELPFVDSDAYFRDVLSYSAGALAVINAAALLDRMKDTTTALVLGVPVLVFGLVSGALLRRGRQLELSSSNPLHGLSDVFEDSSSKKG